MAVSVEGQIRKFSDDYCILSPRDQVEFTMEEWESILNHGQIHQLDQTRLHESLVAGIPNHLRARIWPFLAKSSFLQLFNSVSLASLASGVSPEVQNRIVRDLPRTFPTSPMLRTQDGMDRLYRILAAYSEYDREVGYAQGMNFIAGALLLTLDDEEAAFWTLVSIMGEKQWRFVFTKGTSKLLEMIDRFDSLLKVSLPLLYNHLKECHVHKSLPCIQPFTTLFAYGEFPIEFSIRVLDLFLSEGEDILLTTLIKMLELKQAKILAMPEEECLCFIKTRFIIECVEEFTYQTLLS